MCDQSEYEPDKELLQRNRLCRLPRTGFGVDLLLNSAKNRTDLPNEADVRPMTIAKVAKFKRPKKWKWNQSCDKLVEYGEGTPLRVSPYLQAASKYERGAEACNCNLTGESNNDYHIVLGRTKNAAEKYSLTAEISPRIRRTNWTHDRLKELVKVKTYVRVTGWAMLDTRHIGDKCPIRCTHREIPLVTQLEVCTTTKSQCDAGTGWTPLEDML